MTDTEPLAHDGSTGTDSHRITVLIHGTFANPQFGQPGGSPRDVWWKLTEGPEPVTTADRLQHELSGSGAGDVWEPNATDSGFNYDDVVEWDGLNKHRKRKKAGRNLAASLGRLADERGCTQHAPLEVNFVAHSHGGNVVLEALGHLTPNVKSRQVSLLGTPVLWRYTDPRILYLSVILFAFTAWFAVTLDQIRDPLNESGETEVIESWTEFVITEIILATLLFWLASGVILLLRAVFSRVLPSRPAYGPKPDKLVEILDGRPAVLFISREDEADLMMRMGAAPIDAYRALLRNRPTLDGVGPIKKVFFVPLRIIEWLFLRPVIYVAVAPVLEVLLERFGLGFPLYSATVRNYEMISWVGEHKYVDALETRPINADRLHLDASKVRLAKAEKLEPTDVVVAITREEQLAELRAALLDAIDGLKAQVHLSHSDYYDSQMIIELVANEITAVDRPTPATF